MQRITPAVVAAYKAIRLQALKDSPMAFGSTYQSEFQLSEADWLAKATELNTDDAVGYLAFHDGAPCGIVRSQIDVTDRRRAYLFSMWVAPSHRRTGIGEELINAIETWAIEHAISELLLTVTNINAGAIAFYQQLGFGMTGNTEPYPNDAALFEYEMAKQIAQ